jgi:hypothetical protein
LINVVKPPKPRLKYEILSPIDSRQNYQKFIDAKQKGIAGLVERGTWKVVLKSEIPATSDYTK